ncbi:unnamed protein product [Symbiodinium pilosum]|uniref:J domain-containing protein n=1 Tax=Symbiodinium pilosum TaxID=2952 RepID=A0A812SLK0_SYMPI|nr:unnamed protein product [Symbiodinium pilosum]
MLALLAGRASRALLCLLALLALRSRVVALDPLDAEPVGAGESAKDSGDVVALRLFSPVRSTTQEAIKAEVIAAEAALELRAEVDGLPVVYDSPAVSISLRKVSPEALIQNGAEVEAPDGASVKIPADPRIKGRHGGPVTVTVTSYHAGDAVKEMPKVKYGAQQQLRPEPMKNAEANSSIMGNDSVSNMSNATQDAKNDRVDFFMTKTSVSWRGTVDVKVPGLSAQVPAHDRPWTPYGENVLYPEEKAAVREELERLSSLSDDEKLRGCRKLARQWHPDKHPLEDREKATEIFEYMQELRLALGLSARGHTGESEQE